MAGSVLVSGAGGFVGRHLVGRLGDEAVPLAPTCSTPRLCRGVGRPGRGRSSISPRSPRWELVERPARAWSVNVVGTVNILEAVRREHPEARVLVTSTGEVYGRAARIPTPEDEPPAPLSPYAASKAAAELACGQAARGAGLDVVVARAFNHEGPGRDERFAIGSWARQLARIEAEGGERCL